MKHIKNDNCNQYSNQHRNPSIQKFIRGIFGVSIFVGVTISFLPQVLAAETGPSFSNDSEVGIMILSGNTKSQSLNFNQLNIYMWDENTAKFNANYFRTETSGVRSAKNWSLGLRFERLFSERLGYFLAETIEGNPYLGFLQRYNSDVGLKLGLMRDQDFEWSGELGYRYVKENRIDFSTVSKNFGRAYTEAFKKWENLTARLWFEYLLNVNNTKDYRLNGETSLSASMTKVFSLKTAYLYKFANIPSTPATRQTDTAFTTSLVARF